MNLLGKRCWCSARHAHVGPNIGKVFAWLPEHNVAAPSAEVEGWPAKQRHSCYLEWETAEALCYCPGIIKTVALAL